MTEKQTMEVINRKLDLSLRAVAMLPLFMAAMYDKNPQKRWKEAMKEWEKIDKQYEEIIKYENNNNTTSVEN